MKENCFDRKFNFPSEHIAIIWICIANLINYASPFSEVMPEFKIKLKFSSHVDELHRDLIYPTTVHDEH